MWSNIHQASHTIKAVFKGDDNYSAAEYEETYNYEILSVNGVENGNISVTFNNLIGNDIDNAVIIIAAYDENNILQKVDKQPVNIANEDAEDFVFNMADVTYDKIKVFIWNGFETITPMHEAYEYSKIK